MALKYYLRWLETTQEVRFLLWVSQLQNTTMKKYDGSGYGEGLKGDDIPIEARIMALVDVYDALRSKRAYKEAFKHQKVCELIFADRGTHFDPDVVDAFIKNSATI